MLPDSPPPASSAPRSVPVAHDDEGAPYALLDVDRAARTGVPEAVYAPGKTVDQVVRTVTALVAAGVTPVLATRCSSEQHAALVDAVPGALVGGDVAAWNVRAPVNARCIVVSAGTADQRAATEAAVTMRAFGFDVDEVSDVGIAGVHRLIERVDQLRAADALIVVAGMEGALPTAIAGLVDTPLVAVPTSAGYGSSFEGMTALAAMTASCAPGVSVVGIDNGFGAACVVARWFGRLAGSANEVSEQASEPTIGYGGHERNEKERSDLSAHVRTGSVADG